LIYAIRRCRRFQRHTIRLLRRHIIITAPARYAHMPAVSLSPYARQMRRHAAIELPLLMPLMLLPADDAYAFR